MSESGAVLKTLVITDLVASTRLTEEMGDLKAAQMFARQDRIARDTLAEFNGTEVDKTDGFLLFFPRPIDAVNFALVYHAGLAELSEELGIQLETRVGIHVGEVVISQNSPEDIARGANSFEVEGLAKPFTARLMSLAEGKQTLLSSSAFEVARRAAVGLESEHGELRWLAHGGYVLKGVEEPVPVFEVGVEGFAPLTPPRDTEKAKRFRESDIILGWRPAPGQEVPRRPRWVITEKLGEGGFGEVWLGEHQKTGDRRVFKFCYEIERLRALQREVTLFRLLKEDLGDRPDITRILDWSFDEAPYFIESEYTESGSLLEWAKKADGLETIPLPTRLEIVAQTAEALAAAHSVGVLHKDIKPGNILIRADGDEPKISLTDFGIGQVEDQSRLDQANITVLGMTGAVAAADDSTGTTGTFMFMAPELLEERPATVQADIYALGVLLYQMVAGSFSRPLAPGWERQIDDALLREDIAWTVDGNPQRRLGNALRLAERLRSLDERHREREEQERLQAHEERARKRRKLAWIAAAASSVLFVVSAGFSVMIYRAQQEAEENLQLAKEAVDQMLTEVGSEALADVPQMEEVRRVLLDKARTFYLEFQKREPSDPDLRMEPALAHRRLADIYRQESDVDAADVAYQAAIERLADLVDRYPERSDYRRELANTHNWRGELLRDHADRHDAAKQSYEAALELQEALVAESPESTDLSIDLARTNDNLGILQASVGESARAEISYRDAIDILEAIAESESTAGARNLHLLELGRCYNNLAALLDSEGKTDEARRAFEFAVNALRELVASNPGKRQYRLELAMMAKNLAFFLWRGDGELAPAYDSSSEARAMFAELARPISTISGEYAHSLWVQGIILFDRGDERAARTAFQRSIELSRQVKDGASDYARSGTFHLRFAWLRWVDLPVPASSLAALPANEQIAVCQDYYWLADQLSSDELAGVMTPEDYDATIDVLGACSRLATSAGGANSAPESAQYLEAIETLKAKFVYPTEN